ncbi:MAG: DNA polymerase III subunit beta [Actinobacteria bacterium]|nr:MAG: DNA polymerase III subunit beta [Actinomycetota bacterium]
MHSSSPCPAWALRCADDGVVHGSTGPTTTGLHEEQIPIQGVCTVKFRCDRDALSEALQTVQRGVSSRPGIPALTGVLLDGAADGQLTMTTTDLEVSARLTIDVQVTEPGVALIPARLLTDTVKSLSDAPVDVETDQSQARIRCAAYEGSLRLLPAEDFPGLQEPGGTRVEADAGAFAEAVSQVARAASRDEARPVLTGVLVEVSREGCVLVATDSYRLAVRDLVASADGEAKAIVPERAFSEAGRAAAGDEKGKVEILVDDAQVSFRAGGLTLTSRLIEGEFPNYRQLLPDTHESRLTVSRQQLLDAVRRVGLLARDTTPVRLEFNALGVKLSSSSPDLGQAVETVEARYEGDDLTVAFNPQYLIDGLTAAVGESVRLDVRDGLKPGVVHGESDGFTYLVMPVRLPAAVV